MIGEILARLGSIASDKLTAMVGRGAEGELGVVVLHGGLRTHFLSPEQARRDALKLLDLANLASRPGECPDAGDLDGSGGGIYQRRRVGR